MSNVSVPIIPPAPNEYNAARLTRDFDDVTRAIQALSEATDAAAANGTGLSDGDKGDVTVTGVGSVWTIDADAVTNAKLANMPANAIKANATNASADPTDLAIGPNQIPGRGPTGGLTALTLGSGLSITGSTIAATASGGLFTTVASLTALRAETWSGGRPNFITIRDAANPATEGSNFYWASASTSTDNGLTVIKETAVATGRWLLFRTASEAASRLQLGNEGGVSYFEGVVDPTKNRLLITRGTAASPDTNSFYNSGPMFIEHFIGGPVSSSTSTWGNPFKRNTLAIEARAAGTFHGELNAGAFRSFSDQGASSTEIFKRILVGMSSIGESNAPSGVRNYEVWGANIIAASQGSGIAPVNIVGIEIDLIHTFNGNPSRVLPGRPGSTTNYSGFWAQSDAQSVFSDVAFFASQTAISQGWNCILGYTGQARDSLIDLKNTFNLQFSHGLIIENTFQSFDTDVARFSCAGNVQMKVTGQNDNPIYMRFGPSGSSSLKQVTQGATDSGGAGFRLLRVAN